MEIPYNYDFNGDTHLRTILHKRPDWCTHPLKVVHSPFYYIWQNAEIVNQQLNDYPFFFDLAEFRLGKDQTIPICVHHKSLFLFFMVEGEATFFNPEDKSFINMRQKTFFFSAAPPCRLEVRLKAGSHIALAVAISPDWIERKLKKLSRIQEIVRLCFTEDRTPDSLLLCKIDQQVDSCLDKIFNYPEDNLGVSDGFLSSCISFFLAHYNDKINTGYPDLADQLKTYMDENFCDPDLQVTSLANHFHVTPQTLLNQFKQKYNSTVQGYYTALRMEKADRLMKEKNLSFTEVYDKVGYTEIRSFRATYTRYSERKGKNP